MALCSSASPPHYGIHAAAFETKNDLFTEADLCADFLHGPGPRMLRMVQPLPRPQITMHEIGNKFPAPRGVDDFGMKLEAEKLLFAPLDGRVFRIVGHSHGFKAIEEFSVEHVARCG